MPNYLAETPEAALWLDEVKKAHLEIQSHHQGWHISFLFRGTGVNAITRLMKPFILQQHMQRL